MSNGARPTTHPLVAELARQRLIAIIRADHEVDVGALADLLLDGGIRCVEVTLTTPGAIEAIAALQARRSVGLRVGAGTVLGRADATAAVRAGVDFIVSPTVEPDVVAVAHEAGHAAFIGGLTPTEIMAAWRAGADVVKVFPGRVATPGYFSDVKGPLPHIPLMPTGNVDRETAPAYLKAGAIAVGVGKALINPGHLHDGDLDAVRADIADWRRLVDEFAAPV
ncbi:MAG: bifunctional 4-hydroxy-2-oxoglutarate aldolase/2-dehydro-3-deoxy-phosphogluconate aldolase [Chloroflexi bacterium]|nr:bifunctional 4-hydroxy-2-oxoglutarate aldolase/2-dehydro-3-deoxy-phosphogluconate aldolase [Chloroflexota bacterium]